LSDPDWLARRSYATLRGLIHDCVHGIQHEVHARCTIIAHAGQSSPTAAPVQADSDTGVSITLCAPNFLSKSVMELPTYQGLHNPCPITNARSSFLVCTQTQQELQCHSYSCACSCLTRTGINPPNRVAWSGYGHSAPAAKQNPLVAPLAIRYGPPLHRSIL